MKFSVSLKHHKTLLSFCLIGSLLSTQAASDSSEGVIVKSQPQLLTVKNKIGAQKFVKTSSSTKVHLQTQRAQWPSLYLGDLILAQGHNSNGALKAHTIYERNFQQSDRKSILGYITEVNPSQKSITLIDYKRKPHRFSIQKGTTAFQNYQPTNWLNLHRGQNVSIHFTLKNGIKQAVSIFDESSFLTRKMQAEHGPLLSQGVITKIDLSSRSTGKITLRNSSNQTRTIPFKADTRWILGAKLVSLLDFNHSEVLVFGNRQQATMIVSTRAYNYLMQSY